MVPVRKRTGTKGFGLQSRPFSPGSRTGTNGPYEPGQMGPFVLVIEILEMLNIWEECPEPEKKTEESGATLKSMENAESILGLRILEVSLHAPLYRCHAYREECL